MASGPTRSHRARPEPLSSIAALALGALGVLPSASPGADDPPSRRETDALIEEYFELGPRAVDGARSRQRAILERLETLDVLDPKAESRAREELLELWMEGPKLDRKGRNHLWEDPDRGLYIVEGKTKRPKGLLIGMHGGGLGSGDAGPMASAMSSAVASLGWVGVFPEVLEKTEHGWTDAGTEEFVLELVDRAIRTFGVDPDRVFLSGHSMGGYGTWTLGARHSDRWAALAVAAGAPTPLIDPASRQVVGVDWGVVPNLRNTPMVVYQSSDDPQVTPEVNRAAVAEVDSARQRWGGYERFEYWEVDGRGHDHPPGGYSELFGRVAESVRDPRPQKLVWQPILPWKRQFHWLHWEQPIIGAVLVAELDPEANEVRLECDRGLEGLRLLVDGSMLDLESEVTVRVNGQVVSRRLPPGPRLSVLVETAVTGDPGRTYSVAIEL